MKKRQYDDHDIVYGRSFVGFLVSTNECNIPCMFDLHTSRAGRANELVMLNKCIENKKYTMPCVDIIRWKATVNLLNELRPFRWTIILDDGACCWYQLTSWENREECVRWLVQTRKATGVFLLQCRQSISITRFITNNSPQWILRTYDSIEQYIP
jgi:hypothetical protein